MQDRFNQIYYCVRLGQHCGSGVVLFCKKMEYTLNKGVGRPLDIFGLRGVYIIWCGGSFVVALGAYFVFALINTVVGIAVAAGVFFVGYLFSMGRSKKFGENGFTKYQAGKMTADRIAPKRMSKLIEVKKR